MRYIILDTETTGLSPKYQHRIIEFAALEMLDRRLTGNMIHQYLNPERDIPVEASNIHGITAQQLHGKPIFKDFAQELIDFINGASLIIHNATFDLAFLDHHLIEAGKHATMHYAASCIDTLALARKKFPGAKNNLNSLCDRYKVNRLNRVYHGALVDCHLLAEVYIALTQEQASLMATNTVTLENYHTSAAIQYINAPIVNVTSAEQAAHSAYLNKLNSIS